MAGSLLKKHPFLPLAFLIAAINLLTMPADFYPGDAHAIRLAALHLVKHGSPGVDVSRKPTLGTLVENPGQNYFFNGESQKFFPKWGVFSTLLFAPPIVVENLLFGIGNYFDNDKPISQEPFYSKSFIVTLNIYNTLISLGLAFYLFKITGLFTKRVAVRIVFVLSCFYATFIWNYLRAQTTEIFQVFFFTAFFYHAAAFHRSQLGADFEIARKQLLFCSLWAGALALLKPYFILLFPLLFLFAAGSGAAGKQPFIQSALSRFKKHPRLYLHGIIAPALAVAALVAAINTYQFGSPLETGYSQWKVGGRPHDAFSPDTLPLALWGYLFVPQRSIFIHFPPLIFALLGVRAFAKHHSWELVLAGTCLIFFMLLFGCFSNWSGAWCYGPRYLTFVLPVAALPFLSLLEWIANRIKCTTGAAVAIVVGATLACSAKLQHEVNRLPFMNGYQLDSMFVGKNNEATNLYFQTRHFGMLNADYVAYRHGRAAYFPLEEMRKSFPDEPERVERYAGFLKTNGVFRSNYYFFSLD